MFLGWLFVISNVTHKMFNFPQMYLMEIILNSFWWTCLCKFKSNNSVSKSKLHIYQVFTSYDQLLINYSIVGEVQTNKTSKVKANKGNFHIWKKKLHLRVGTLRGHWSNFDIGSPGEIIGLLSIQYGDAEP